MYYTKHAHAREKKETHNRQARDEGAHQRVSNGSPRPPITIVSTAASFPLTNCFIGQRLHVILTSGVWLRLLASFFYPAKPQAVRTLDARVSRACFRAFFFPFFSIHSSTFFSRLFLVRRGLILREQRLRESFDSNNYSFDVLWRNFRTFG